MMPHNSKNESQIFEHTLKDASDGENDSSEEIIIGLSVTVAILAILVIIFYWYRSKQVPVGYKQINTNDLLHNDVKSRSNSKPKLTLQLPQVSISNIEEQKKKSRESISIEHHFLSIKEQDNIDVVPTTPSTPLTPISPMPQHDFPSVKKITLAKSISLPAKSVFASKDINADGLWRNAVKKATNTQFLQTQPKKNKRISYCASGKIKFSLMYDTLNQKELIVKIVDFTDLPLSRETGISVPFVKVYLYPQNAHAMPLTEVSKNLGAFKLEILSYPKESTCTFYGCPINKLCSSALKFVILDYDRFSRSEFVADSVILLDEVSLEGESIIKHLNVRLTNLEKDKGSLLISLCYQPNVSRMCIIVLKASGLQHGEGSHAPDHFVKISLMRNNTVLDKRRTRVIKKTISPVFNERLVFPIDNQGMRSLVFVFDVIRYDSKIKQEKIANVVLGNHSNTRQVTPHEIQHFNEMLESPQRQIAEWHKLVV